MGTVGLATAALITLAGCSGGDSSGSSTDTPSAPAQSASPRSSPPASEMPSTPGTAAPSQSATGSTSPQGGAAAGKLLDAGAIAVDQIDGSTLTSIESDQDGSEWEVQVVTSDGTEHKLGISGDGSKVLRGPTTDEDDASDQAKHRRRVDRAKIDYRKAADIMASAVPGGHITELNLDGHHGKTVWEGDVMVNADTKHEVMIDAASGKILRNQPDS